MNESTSSWNYCMITGSSFLNAILRKMTVKIEVIFIGGRTGNIFVRWPNMFPYLGIEISFKNYCFRLAPNCFSIVANFQQQEIGTPIYAREIRESLTHFW
jgi:hypothetical protein